jgi:hypothetical protein
MYLASQVKIHRRLRRKYSVASLTPQMNAPILNARAPLPFPIQLAKD